MDSQSEASWSTTLRLDCTDQGDGSIRLMVHGDIDMTTSDHFKQTVMRLVSEAAVTRLVVDAARLDFIDSNGVTVLVKACRAADERGITFAIANAQAPVQGLLEMLGVYDLLTRAHAD